MTDKIRPTKKQRELLGFIEQFIGENGYSPSYREIMVGCGYNSVATVALHVNNLIRRGHIVKRGRSARSLEVVHKNEPPQQTASFRSSDQKWLISAVEEKFRRYEAAPSEDSLDELYVLVGALKALGLDDAMRSFLPRLPRV